MTETGSMGPLLWMIDNLEDISDEARDRLLNQAQEDRAWLACTHPAAQGLWLFLRYLEAINYQLPSESSLVTGSVRVSIAYLSDDRRSVTGAATIEYSVVYPRPLIRFHVENLSSVLNVAKTGDTVSVQLWIEGMDLPSEVSSVQDFIAQVAASEEPDGWTFT